MSRSHNTKVKFHILAGRILNVEAHLASLSDGYERYIYHDATIIINLIPFDSPTPTPLFQVGLSLYVSNIGSSSFIGLAGTASASGYAVIAYEFHVRFHDFCFSILMFRQFCIIVNKKYLLCTFTVFV